MKKPYNILYRAWIAVKYEWLRFFYFLNGSPFPIKPVIRLVEKSCDILNPDAVAVGFVISDDEMHEMKKAQNSMLMFSNRSDCSAWLASRKHPFKYGV